MAASNQHAFLVLTKRPRRMLRWFAWARESVHPECSPAVGCLVELETALRCAAFDVPIAWPLPNVWLGTSVEDQAAADERIPCLLKTPAAKRFVSCEPLLGAVDLHVPWGGIRANALQGWESSQNGIHWVIVGGESGPGARPMHPDWARSIRDQCQAADVPFFFKQWGHYAPTGQPRNGSAVAYADGKWPQIDLFGLDTSRPHSMMNPVGKKAAGRLLDGCEWNEMPSVTGG